MVDGWMDVYVAATVENAKFRNGVLLEIGYRKALQEGADDVESMLGHG